MNGSDVFNILNITEDVLQNILSFLDLKDLKSLKLVCKTFYNVIKSFESSYALTSAATAKSRSELAAAYIELLKSMDLLKIPYGYFRTDQKTFDTRYTLLAPRQKEIIELFINSIEAIKKDFIINQKIRQQGISYNNLMNRPDVKAIIEQYRLLFKHIYQQLKFTLDPELDCDVRILFGIMDLFIKNKIDYFNCNLPDSNKNFGQELKQYEDSFNDLITLLQNSRVNKPFCCKRDENCFHGSLMTTRTKYINSYRNRDNTMKIISYLSVVIFFPMLGYTTFFPFNKKFALTIGQTLWLVLLILIFLFNTYLNLSFFPDYFKRTTQYFDDEQTINEYRVSFENKRRIVLDNIESLKDNKSNLLSMPNLTISENDYLNNLNEILKSIHSLQTKIKNGLNMNDPETLKYLKRLFEIMINIHW